MQGGAHHHNSRVCMYPACVIVQEKLLWVKQMPPKTHRLREHITCLYVCRYVSRQAAYPSTSQAPVCVALDIVMNIDLKTCQSIRGFGHLISTVLPRAKFETQPDGAKNVVIVCLNNPKSCDLALDLFRRC